MPKIVLTGWCLWVVYQLVLFFNDSIWRSGGNHIAWSASIGAVLVPAIGCWLAWRLYARPRRSVAIWFAIICLVLLWKFCLGEIVFRMHPSMGGHTFGGAAAAWWSLVSSSVIRLAVKLLSLTLVLFSPGYWLAYCLSQRVGNQDQATAAPVASDKAICAECGEVFSMQDMIHHGGFHVCARCKPGFLQRLSEGARTRISTKT